MRFQAPRTPAFVRILGLTALLAAPNYSEAQGVISPNGPNGFLRLYPSDQGWGFRSHCVAIPRTYSYQYNYWYNQPCHFRVVGPDGRTYWRTTVRGFPWGMQWLAR
ncbi:MAG TPA: hypothetical protein VKP69_07685 [Isosphaeraceae bacterium]|nr:hypothetical protein [Isosphaeraceae bacterium]